MSNNVCLFLPVKCSSFKMDLGLFVFQVLCFVSVWCGLQHAVFSTETKPIPSCEKGMSLSVKHQRCQWALNS